MDISQKGIDLIKSFEGCRLDAYQDAVGVWTIGYGHTDDVHRGEVITQAKAEQLLHHDLERYVNAVISLVKVPINQNQFDALVSFAYNLGIGALGSSTLLEYLNEGKFSEAAGEFGKWVHAGGKVLAGLVRRREEEMKLFLTPIKKEDDDMFAKALVINKFSDYPAAEPLAVKLQAPIFLRQTAEEIEVAKEIYVCGGSKEGLKGSHFIELTGKDRYEAAAAIGAYLKKL